jgi:hypothetical protein
VTADHKAIAAWVETATPTSIYAFTTSDADVLTANPSPDDIFSFLQALNYKRTIGQYATTQTAVYPNNIYAIVAIMGYACGQNSGLANSSFTLKFKEEVGIATEPLTSSQVTIIEGKNGNLYLSYGNSYELFEQGKMVNGDFFDEVLNIDMLVNEIQLSVMDLLVANPKIPQTDEGNTQIMRTIGLACEESVNMGFLAPGTWNGPNVLNLKTGDVLPKGYVIQSPPMSQQSAADRALRKASPIYVCVKEAGAVHSLVIGVYVDR